MVGALIHGVIASGPAGRAEGILKGIGGIVIIVIVGGAVCFMAAIVAYLAYFIIAGCAVVALISYISGAFVVCWWAIGIGVACLIFRIVVAAVADIE